MDKSAKKLGLLGGTFDPIHNAHIEIALLAKQRHDLDEVHFIVAKDPPLKEHVVLDAENRFQLAVKALESYTGLIASRVELDRPGKSYTYLTIEDYKKLFPEAELFWIMGEDAFSNLEKWKNYDYLKENLNFLVFPRTTCDGLSSTQIKERIKNKLSLKGLVSAEIEQLIVEYYC